MYYKKLLLCAMVSAMATYAEGAPSRMRPVEVVGPDGQLTEVVAVGDEHEHWFVYPAGGDVDWLPKVAVPKATPAMKGRHTGDGREKISTFPTKGELPFLVVLVEFANKGFAFADPNEEFAALLNEPGYSRYNGKGSVADYYRDNSGGAFRPMFETVGPVRLGREYSYYGGGSDDSAAGLMVMEACRAIDGLVDFSRYDLDGDGRVDNIYFYYAGKGEADGGDPGTIWPHSWNLSDQGRELMLDGVAIDAYACSPELDGSDKPNGIGTFCHEFAHVLGLPDLYASSYSGALHPATWSLMASGNYNDDGRTPPGFSAYERFELGWIEPKTLSYPLTVAMEPIGESNFACRIPTERTNEYFLLENRQQSGWDSSLPGHGMLVWHIDYNPDIWDRNVVNNNASHQYVDIVEANNAGSHSQDAGFPFPGSSRVTSLTSSTRPALVSWSGTAIDVPLTGISESSSGIVSFDACGGKTPVGAVTGLVVSETGMERCRLEWSPAVMADEYVVTVSDDSGDKVNEMTTKASYAEISGLWPGRSYVASVCGRDRYESGEPAEVMIVMPDATFEYQRVEPMEASGISGDGFTASWLPLEEADGYEVTVGKLTVEKSGLQSCGFDGKSLPEGWGADATAWNSVAGYYGQAAPSLRMSADGSSLTTATYDEEIVGFSLFLRASSLTEGSVLAVRGMDAGGYSADVAELPLPASGSTVICDELPVGMKSLSFSFVKSGNTVVSIDDVTLFLGSASQTALPEWNRREVGDVTSVRIDGLERDSRYCYFVTGLCAGRRSLVSRMVEVKTGSSSSIETVADGLATGTPGKLSNGIYTIDGRKTDVGDSLAPGVYVKVADGAVHKIVVR